VNYAPAHLSPLLGFALSHDQDVCEQAESSQRLPKASGLLEHVIDRRLDHEEVEITVGTSVASRVRTERITRACGAASESRRPASAMTASSNTGPQ
jgi:hypothetical protein